MQTDKQKIRYATGEAIDCLYQLHHAAEGYLVGAKKLYGPRFIEIAYRLEAARDALFDALSGRFDAFAGVAASPVRFGPVLYASAHQALYAGCGILISEMATAIVHHHYPDWPPRDREIAVLPDTLSQEADFLSAMESVIKDFMHNAPTEDAVNELSVFVEQELARVQRDQIGANIASAKEQDRAMAERLPAATSNSERDRWVYEQCCKLVTYSSISRGVEEKTEWEPLPTVQAVRNAANRYAKTHNLPLIPSRQPGRPPK